MITKLRWREPAHSSVMPQKPPEGGAGRLVEKKTDDGHSEFVPAYSYDTRDSDEQLHYTVLKVRTSHLADFQSMLCWYTAQSNIPLPKTISKNGDHTQIRIYGEFLPALKESELHQMYLDYFVLHHYFETWEQLIALADRHTIALSELVLSLANTVTEMHQALLDLGSVEMSKRMKPIDPLPVWAKRFLEIRKALNR